MEKLFWPDLFIVGGGISKQLDKYLPLLSIRTPIIPAQLLKISRESSVQRWQQEQVNRLKFRHCEEGISRRSI